MLLLAAVCVVALQAAVFETSLVSGGSARARLIKEGKWKQILASHRRNLKTGSQPFLGTLNRA